MRLNLFTEDYKLPKYAYKFEWILPDAEIIGADWLSEKTDKKGFLTLIETYCNPNDLLAIRLSFNNGQTDFKTPFFGCNLEN